MRKELKPYFLSSALASFGENMAVPYLPLFIASLTVSPFEVGLLASAVSLAAILSQLLWGFTGDSLGRRKPFLILGSFFSGLLYVIISRAVSVKQLLFAQASQSFLSGMDPPNRNALLSKVISKKDRARIAATLQTVGKFFVIPAVVLGGWVLREYGLRAIFLPAAFFLVLSGLVFFSLKEPKSRRAGSLTADIFSELKRNHGFRFLLFGTFVWAFGMNLVSPLVPTMVFAIKLKFGAGELGLLSIIATLTALALAIPAGILADRHGSKLFVAFSYALGTLIILGYIFAASFWQVAILVFLSAVAGAAGGGATFSLVCRLTPPQMRGSLMGLFALVVGLTSAIAPALGGFLWANIGFSATFLIAALLHVLGGLIIYLRIR